MYLAVIINGTDKHWPILVKSKLIIVSAVKIFFLHLDFRNQSKPASLIRERLDSQVREHRIQQGELESRRPTLAKLLSSAREAALTPSNARIAKKLEQKAEDIYSKWVDECNKIYCRYLSNCIQKLRKHVCSKQN